MSNSKRIAVSQVRCGMYIQRLDGSWLHHPFWRKSFALQDEADLKTLRESGITHVWIDIDRGDDVEPPPAELAVGPGDEAPLPESPPDPPVVDEPVAVIDEPAAVHLSDTLKPGASRLHRVGRKPPTTEDWIRARKICDQARQVVGTLFNDASGGRPIDAGSARPLVDSIIDIVSDQPTTLSTLARLKKQDDYTYMHSVAVCSLMTTLALELGLNDAQVRESAMAGLLHDIGKMTVDLAILNKPGKLSDSEFEQIKDHTTNGYRILKDTGGVSDITLDVCLHHHERIDGRGYPDGLPEGKISLFAKMGTVCDVYDAITSDRPYKKAWEPAVALHNMSKWAEGAYDILVFQAFVKSLGVYPTGSLVRLQSGRLAVVVDQSPAGLLVPMVKVIFSINSKMPLPHEIVDLSAAECRDKIVAREDPSRWGFTDLTRFLVPGEAL